MTSRVVIFGASGQDGRYLRELCLERRAEVVGVSRSAGSDLQGDVGEVEDVERLVREIKPTHVFHLAANSTTRHDALFENHRTISTGTINLLESVHRHAPASRVFITGSAVQFKNRGDPISEMSEFEPSSPYAVARIHATYAARYYRRLGVRTYVGYLFHHDSPYRKGGHVSQIVASAAARIASGDDEELVLGDLGVEKEWTFAGDVAQAMWILVNQDNVSEVVIGSGETHRIEDWVRTCFSVVGLDWRQYVRQREAFVPEYRSLSSKPSVLMTLGWRPRVSFQELAEMMVSRAGRGGNGS